MRKVALIGNPNCGKTSLFNALTGSSQKVGNWPGVTVDRKSGVLKLDKVIEIQDLPGIYSLSPYTSEEIIARDYLLSDEPNVIINILDATNLERNLYLSTQLLEMGLPCLIALNMMDIVEKNGKIINCNKLSYQLDAPVVTTSALKRKGNENLVFQLQNLTKKSEFPKCPIYDNSVEAALNQIQELLVDYNFGKSTRYYLIKLFERDGYVTNKLSLPNSVMADIEEIIAITERMYDEDAESIIINQRYAFIEKVCRMSQIKNDHFELKYSDKIDRVITNRFLALPIFALIMFLVYYISIQTLGSLGSDWLNEQLFGQIIPENLLRFLNYIKVENWLISLIIDGIIAGIGAVLGFVPQLFILFLCLGILEDIGYMSRIAFVMDRVFRKFGLSGKTFIPMLIATGCGVPAIMASRTIENESDRKITIITSTFMPCSAKMSIVALISGAFFPNNPFIAPSAYFIGIIAIIFSGIALKKTSLLSNHLSPFIMELPAYHFPHYQTIIRYAFQKAWSFVKRAGTIIFVLTILLWFLTSYNIQLRQVSADQSIMASIGKTISWLFVPLGFGNWKATVATFSGLMAKETVVATFGILYHQGNVTETSRSLWDSLHGDYSSLTAYSFLIFNLLCAPCFAAIGAIKREMETRKWFFFAILFQTLLAYTISLIIYQFASFLISGDFTVFTLLAIILFINLTYFILRKPKRDGIQIISINQLHMLEEKK